MGTINPSGDPSGDIELESELVIGVEDVGIVMRIPFETTCEEVVGALMEGRVAVGKGVEASCVER